MTNPNDRCFYVYTDRYGMPDDAVEPCNQKQGTHRSDHGKFVEAPLTKERLAELLRNGATHKDFNMVDGTLFEKQPSAPGALEALAFVRETCEYAISQLDDEDALISAPELLKRLAALSPVPAGVADDDPKFASYCCCPECTFHSDTAMGLRETAAPTTGEGEAYGVEQHLADMKGIHLNEGKFTNGWKFAIEELEARLEADKKAQVESAISPAPAGEHDNCGCLLSHAQPAPTTGEVLPHHSFNQSAYTVECSTCQETFTGLAIQMDEWRESHAAKFDQPAEGGAKS